MVALKRSQMAIPTIGEILPSLKSSVEHDQLSVFLMIYRDYVRQRKSSYIYPEDEEEDCIEIERQMISLFHLAADAGSLDCMKYIERSFEISKEQLSIALVRVCELGTKAIYDEHGLNPTYFYYNVHRVYSPVAGLRKKIHQSKMIEWLLEKGADPNYIIGPKSNICIEVLNVIRIVYKTPIQALMWYQNEHAIQQFSIEREDTIITADDIDFLIEMARNKEHFEKLEELVLNLSILLKQEIAYYFLIQLSKYALLDLMKIVYCVINTEYKNPRLWSYITQHARSFLVRQWVCEISNVDNQTLTKWIIDHPLDEQERKPIGSKRKLN